ncbi:MAG TPA: kelch repeat-containing protein, partial [Candidatus Polarisedimenticolaceae bacterium]|nr:kelch repeat-containing protein [Candidatus Polarisedimenticolaceae bacterium]
MSVLASLAILAASALDPDASVRTAMLRVYVHGVDDRLAAEVVAERDLPALRALLGDPAFPRRDNVVAFLAHRDGGDAMDPLLRFLQDPPRSLAIPEEERAALLVPRALGHLARRGSERARAALLEMTRGDAVPLTLAAAAAKAPDPEGFLSDLYEEAVFGLGFAGGPQVRSRLAALGGGVVRLPGSRPTLADAALRALGGTVEAGVGEEAREAPLVGGLDLQDLSHDAPLTWANHPALARPMTEEELRPLLREASLHAGRQDYPDDVACCVTVSPSGTARTFGQVGDGLDVLDSEGEMIEALNDPAARVKVVRQINFCGGPATNAAGCADRGGPNMVVVRLSDREAGLWLHEYGHNVGLAHVSDERAVMYGAILSSDLLSQEECDAFHAPIPATGLTPVVTDLCGDDDQDQIAGSADACTTVFDPVQTDTDDDGLGDVCDPCPSAPRPPSPPLLSPGDGADNRPGAPALEWGEVAGALSYDVLVATPMGQLAAQATTSAPAWTVSSLLQAGSTYAWSARATTACGVGPWTRSRSFTTCPLPAPTVQGPEDHAVTGVVGLYLVWSRVIGARDYVVQVARNATFTQELQETILQESLFHPALEPGTTYYWRVRVRGVCGEGAWSRPRSLTTCRTPDAALSRPADRAIVGTRAPLLDWQDVAGAVDYVVEVALDPAFTEVLQSAPSWESVLRVQPPLRGGPATYYWRVAGRGSCGNGSSPVFQFQVCPPPTGSAGLWLDLPPLPGGERAEPAVMYDPVRHRTLLFGGCKGASCDQDAASMANDLWAYDDRSGAWRQLMPSGSAPSPRMGAHALYDPVRDRMLVFGGRRGASDATPLLDGWTLALSGSPAWSMLGGTGEVPAFFHGFTWAVYDGYRDRLLVGTFDDARLHALDLATSVWTARSTASPPHPEHPIARGGSVVLDPAGDRLLCFGGLWEDGQTRAFRNAVSELRLNAPVPDWTELHPAGPLPDARAHQ